MKAGVARATITPPVGLELSGWCFGASRGVHDDLFARTLVLESGDRSAVVITCDLIGFETEYADTIRHEVSRRYGIPFESILVSCSHTHSGPGTMKLRDWGAVDEEYVRTVIKHILGTVDVAHATMFEARIGHGHGVVDGVCRNRRRDGNGLVDAKLPVLRVDSEDGAPRAVLMNYSCHPVAAHDWENLVSADYPGYAIRVLEKIMSPAPMGMFTTGAAGDINPVEYHHIKYARQYGTMVGGEALKVAESITTGSSLVIRSARSVLSLPVQPLPSRDTLRKMILDAKKQLEDIPSVRNNRQARSEAKIRLEWAEDALAVTESGALEETVEMEIQAIALNDLVFLCLPGELFVEIGLNIKERSPFRTTLIVELANGSFAYIPTESAHEQKGYELDLAVKVYGLYALEQGAGTIVETEAVRLLETLHQESSAG